MADAERPEADQLVAGPCRHYEGLDEESARAIRPFMVAIEFELARRNIADVTITLRGCNRIPASHIPARARVTYE